MEWSDSALVLSLGRFRESDIWVRMLTRRHGIVSAFAFGGSRSRRRFAGCLDLFNELRISTRTTGNGLYLSLQEGMLVNGPRRLRNDWKRLGMLANCVRFMEALGVPPDGSVSAFSLLRDTLLLLEQARRVEELLPALFRLRLASEQGYVPSFGKCTVCGGPVVDWAGFFVTEGVVTCANCVSNRGIMIPLRAASLDVLRQVQETSPLHWKFAGDNPAEEEASGEKKVFLSPADRRECARAIDGFVQYHLGLVWDRGKFRRI